jgi:hypothetical protein
MIRELVSTDLAILLPLGLFAVIMVVWRIRTGR